MPIYEYRCRGCDAHFELLVRGSRTPACPACEGTDLDRLVSRPVVNSETTRAQSMRAAKARDKAQATERVNEQIRYEQSHND